HEGRGGARAVVPDPGGREVELRSCPADAVGSQRDRLQVRAGRGPRRCLLRRVHPRRRLRSDHPGVAGHAVPGDLLLEHLLPAQLRPELHLDQSGRRGRRPRGHDEERDRRGGSSRGHERVLAGGRPDLLRSEEHTSELQSRFDLVCRRLLEKKNLKKRTFFFVLLVFLTSSVAHPTLHSFPTRRSSDLTSTTRTAPPRTTPRSIWTTRSATSWTR